MNTRCRFLSVLCSIYKITPIETFLTFRGSVKFYKNVFSVGPSFYNSDGIALDEFSFILKIE